MTRPSRARIGETIARHFLPLALLGHAWGWAFYAALWLRDGKNPLLHFEGPHLLGMIPWKATQYYVNYPEHGFVRRGLIGTLFHPIPVEHAPAAILALSLVSGGLAVLAFHLFFRAALRATPADRRGYLHGLMAVVALSPLGLCQIAYDAGRYDVWGLILFLAAGVLLVRGHRVAVVLLTVLALLIHEGFALYGAGPLVVLAFLREHRGRRLATPVDLLRALAARPLGFPTLYAIVVAALTVALRIWGGSEAAGSVPFGNGHMVWSETSFAIMQPLDTVSRVTVSALAGLCLLAGVALMRADPGRATPVLAALAAPLLFYAAGGNWARFTHLQMMSLVIFATLAVAWLDARPPPQTSPARRLLPGLVLLLPLGPIGITEVFPYVRTALGMLAG